MDKRLLAGMSYFTEMDFSIVQTLIFYYNFLFWNILSHKKLKKTIQSFFQMLISWKIVVYCQNQEIGIVTILRTYLDFASF